MPVELENAVALRKAMKEYTPELAKETQKEIAKHLKVVTNEARGYVPSSSPLSGWAKAVGVWEYRAFNASTMKSGIGYSTTPSKPNRRGFRSLASIYNKSAAGAIYETAGRLNAQGNPPARRVAGWTGGAFGKGELGQVWESGKGVNKSANPYAGKQFINSLPPLVDSQQSSSAGRRTRKTKGRLIFRAWANDQGKTTAAVVKAIQAANMKVVTKVNARGEVDYRSKG
jgi:hypothetical protein